MMLLVVEAKTKDIFDQEIETSGEIFESNNFKVPEKQKDDLDLEISSNNTIIDSKSGDFWQRARYQKMFNAPNRIRLQVIGGINAHIISQNQQQRAFLEYAFICNIKSGALKFICNNKPFELGINGSIGILDTLFFGNLIATYRLLDNRIFWKNYQYLQTYLNVFISSSQVIPSPVGLHGLIQNNLFSCLLSLLGSNIAISFFINFLFCKIFALLNTENNLLLLNTYNDLLVGLVNMNNGTLNFMLQFSLSRIINIFGMNSIAKLFKDIKFDILPTWSYPSDHNLIICFKLQIKQFTIYLLLQINGINWYIVFNAREDLLPHLNNNLNSLNDSLKKV